MEFSFKWFDYLTEYVILKTLFSYIETPKNHIHHLTLCFLIFTQLFVL